MTSSVHVPLHIQKKLPEMGILYKECRPGRLLNSHIAFFWILRFSDIDYPVKTTPPDGGVDIIIDMENPLDPVLYGQSASFFAVPGGRTQNIFGVRLRPGAAHLLFSIPAEILYDMPVPLFMSRSKC